MSPYQILDIHTIIDMFCSKLTSHLISQIRFCLRCDIVQRNLFSQNKSTIVYICMVFFTSTIIPVAVL